MLTSTDASSLVHLSVENVDSDLEAQFIGMRKQVREASASMKKKINRTKLPFVSKTVNKMRLFNLNVHCRTICSDQQEL